MPLPLHPHLKRGLDLDEFHVDPEDVIEDAPRAHVDPEELAAKRQRIENIAARYLRGQRPMILSAGLRGPFNNGWKNPWAKKIKALGRPAKRENTVSSDKPGIKGKRAKDRPDSVEARRRTRSAGRKTVGAQTIASPLGSRAVEDAADNMNETYTLEEIEVQPPTAPLPDEEDTSGTTEFFSVDTERCVRSRSTLTNPLWLRRPDYEGKFDMKQSVNGNTEVSPTRSRSALPQTKATGKLQLARPKAAPLEVRTSPASAPPHEDIRSSASASMVISSALKPIAPFLNGTVGSPALQKPYSTSTIKTAPVPPSEARPAQLRSAVSTQTATPVTVPKSLPADLVPHPPNSVSKNAPAYSTSQQDRPSRQDVQRTAKRLADLLPTFSESNSQPNRPSQGNLHTDKSLRQPQHDLVALPAPNSSTRFVYKHVGGTKWTIGNAPRSKPRAVDFNSSPSNKKGTTSKQKSTNVSTIHEANVSEPSPVVADVHSQSREALGGSQADESKQEQQSLRSSSTSRQSAMSTQAAMLLAQLEFQESTFPTSSSGTPRPWSQVQEETPQSVMPEYSPAITPLSVFRPQLEQPDGLTSVLRDPPISTQDLFAAVSPFAFSTVKKKPMASQRSNLSVAMMPFDDVDKRTEATTSISPISSADRIPLKEKNTGPSPWSLAFDKGLRATQDSPQSKARRFSDDVEPTQLGLHGSMDDYGPSGSLHFTDHLLRNLNGT